MRSSDVTIPRILAQAWQAYEFANPAGLVADAVIYLDILDVEARTRHAGQARSDRSDDDPTIIDRRLHVFHAETCPLLDFYRKRGILVAIDGTGPSDAVSASIFDAPTGPRMPN